MSNRSPGSSSDSHPPEGHPSDESLMRSLADGEAQALDQLMDRHWEVVLDYAVRLTTCGDSAQDLAQEAFIDLWKGRSGWDSGSQPRSILLRMIRNRSLNMRRWRDVRTRLEPEVKQSEMRRRVPSPVQDFAARQTERRFRRALNALSSRRREVFTLARFQGLSYHEIAEVLGTSRQTVANQMSAALAELRGALSQAGGSLADTAD